MAEGRRHPHALSPLFPDEASIDGTLEERVETAIVLGAVQCIARLLTDRQAWPQAITQHMTQPKERLRRAVLSDTMCLRSEHRLVGQEPSQHLHGFAEGTRHHLGVSHAVLVGTMRLHRQGWIVIAEGARRERAEQGTRLQPKALPIGRGHRPVAPDGTQRQAMREVDEQRLGGLERSLPEAPRRHRLEHVRRDAVCHAVGHHGQPQIGAMRHQRGEEGRRSVRHPGRLCSEVTKRLGKVTPGIALREEILKPHPG